MATSDQAQEYMGPALDPEKFLKQHYSWAADEASAASDAGERRQAIGAMFENMRLESKAAGQARAILKMKNEGKQRDAVRAWQQLLPMLEQEVLGEGAADMFPANAVKADEKVEPLSFEDAAE